MQQKLAAAQVARLDKEVKAWQQEERRLTEQEAKRKANEARRAALIADPGMQALATENQEFAELAESLVKKTQLEIVAQEEIRVELERVQKQFQRAKDRVETIGLTDAIGQLPAYAEDGSAQYRGERKRCSRKAVESPCSPGQAVRAGRSPIDGKHSRATD